jgi:membrane protein DedA with SNARE-associated domain
VALAVRPAFAADGPIDVPAWLTDLFARYGYAVVFIGVLLENAGLPVPGETVLLAGGALSRLRQLSLFWVIVTAVAGAVIGDNIGFLIGRRGGRALAERHGWKIGLTQARLEGFDKFFARHGAKTVFIARFVTGLRVFGAVLAGGSDMAWKTFLVFNATGAVVWATSVAMAGYSLAYSWSTLVRVFGDSGLVALVVVVILAAIAMMHARQERKS